MQAKFTNSSLKNECEVHSKKLKCACKNTLVIGKNDQDVFMTLLDFGGIFKSTKLFILIQNIRYNILCLVCNVIDKLVGILVMFLKLWTNDTIVNYDRSIAFNWKHTPNEEDTLQKIEKLKIIVELDFLKIKIMRRKCGENGSR